MFFGLIGANFVTFTIIYSMPLKLLTFILRTSESKSLCSNFIIMISSSNISISIQIYLYLFFKILNLGSHSSTNSYTSLAIFPLNKNQG